MGIPRKAVKRAAEKALTKGIDRNTSRGLLRCFIEATHRKHGAPIVKVYGNHVFIFGSGKLVTVYEVPAWGR
jgi:hypothetical protein